jgi:hypothetical protein
MAINSIWIVAASLIAAYDFTKARDIDGNIIEPTAEAVEGII